MVTHYQIRRRIPFPSAIEYALNYIPQLKNERGISIANHIDFYTTRPSLIHSLFAVTQPTHSKSLLHKIFYSCFR